MIAQIETAGALAELAEIAPSPASTSPTSARMT
jgi:hypothetical protein